MAYHRKLVLPAFKVTKRSTVGYIVERNVPRGFKSKEKEPVRPQDTPEVSTSGEDGIDFNGEPSLGPGLYEISQKASVSAWESIRKSILKAVTESNAMPKNQLCTCCNEVLATFRCVQCGPCIYFCASCLPRQHLQSNIFHMPEQWKVCSEREVCLYLSQLLFAPILQDGTYVPVTLDSRCIDVHPGHTCSTKREVSICCVDEYGKIRNRAETTNS